MCTVIVSFEPGSAIPVLVVGVRDEFLARPWRFPGAHWPDRPGVLGGQDLQAGGTWLAVDPMQPAVSCVLNGFGPTAGADGRRSRGDLPLGAPLEDPVHYDPFHLVRATALGVRIWSWDGRQLDSQELSPGLHIVTNMGLDGIRERDAPEQAVTDIRQRLEYFRPRLAAARPEPGDGPVATAWREWLPLFTGDGLAREDSRALLVRREFGEHEIWGSSSVSLVALRRDGLRYDFSAVPAGDAGFEWVSVA
ncbi:NRDE family protein [Hamadaea sp. NPDC051192]|uniref:NRDE family protein n=1 Tax=Hamadaea sp. NPDC051192 TaxID=3154940 RepID=UPI003424E882